MPLFRAIDRRFRRGGRPCAQRCARRARAGAARGRDPRPRRRLRPLGRRRPLRRAARPGWRSRCSRRRTARPDFAVAQVEDRDWVAQVRAELTPVEAGRFVVYGSHDRAPHCAEPHRARDRGGRGLRHRPSRDDAGLPRGARPSGSAPASGRVASPTSAAAPGFSRWRRRRSGRRGRSPATSTRWRPRSRACERGGERPCGPHRLRHGRGLPPPPASQAGRLRSRLRQHPRRAAQAHGRRHGAAHQRSGRAGDPLRDPCAAGQGRRGRLPRLGLRARGDGGDRRVGDAGDCACGAERSGWLSGGRERPRSPRSRRGAAPMSDSCASDRSRRAASVSRARRQVASRSKACSTAVTARWVVTVPRGSGRGAVS